VSVAILGSRWFRVADVDPASLRLGNDDGLDTPVAGRPSGLFAKLTDENHDGFPDRLAEFDKREMVRNGNLAAGTPTMVLLGRLKNGPAIVRKAKRPEVRLGALAVNAELRVSTSRPCRRPADPPEPASLPSSPPPRTRW
jgi:hypothetical protein